MRMPRQGEKGFTLIELLIVVAILGVLAAVVIPNVSRFMGAGQSEAAETELSNVQTAVVSMMVDNDLAALPYPVAEADATSDMSAFPDATTPATDDLVEATPDKGWQGGVPAPKDGYLLYQHDIVNATGDNFTTVNYVATKDTTGTYWVDEYGTVYQKTTGY